MTQKFANHLRAYFSDSAFIRNKDNANYVAKSYMMAQKMCENNGFLDIIYIYDIGLEKLMVLILFFNKKAAKHVRILIC